MRLMHDDYYGILSRENTLERRVEWLKSLDRGILGDYGVRPTQALKDAP